MLVLVVFSVPILLTVHAMVMDCGIHFMFRIPNQVYCNKSKKATAFCLQHVFCPKTMHPSPLHRLGTVLDSRSLHVRVFILQREYI